MNKYIFISAISALLMTACVSRQEIIVGKDSNGNEIVQEVGYIDKAKASVARAKLAVNQINEGRIADAKKNLEIANDYDSSSEFVYLAWSYYYQSVKDEKNAVIWYEKTISLFPESGTAHTNYGSYLCGLGKVDEAESHFLKAVAIPTYSDMSRTYEEAAVCAYQYNKVDKAKTYFERAMDYGGTSPTLLYSYAKFSYLNNDFEKADSLMIIFDKHVHKDNPAALLLKVKIATALGQYATAEIFGRKLIRKFPNSKEAKQYKQGEY
jgi:type IV pilus assembly protein PilF